MSGVKVDPGVFWLLLFFFLAVLSKNLHEK
jgi:hypothetical protein